MSELRRTSRRRVCYGARIDGAGGLGVDCAVADLSEDGARLRVRAATPLPQTFDLTIACRGRRHRAALVWRRAEACGVRFVDRPVSEEAEAETLRRELRHSRAEAARLRARLAAHEAPGPTLDPAGGTLH